MTPTPLARTTDFGGLRIEWDERVLEPRPWTIAQPRWLAELSSDAPDGPALELFCGAGQMGLALARLSGRPVVLGDLNPVACELARTNAAAAGLDVDVRHAPVDATARDGETFALMLVDPPWVASADVGVFPDDPTLAIDGGPEGLDLARTAVDVIDRHLAPGGHAVLQLGFAQQVDDLWSSTSTGLELVSVRDHRPGGVLAHLRAPTATTDGARA